MTRYKMVPLTEAHNNARNSDLTVVYHGELGHVQGIVDNPKYHGKRDSVLVWFPGRPTQVILQQDLMVLEVVEEQDSFADSIRAEGSSH